MGGDHLWDAIGAIAEIVGAIAVVVSVAYLASQIRQNTRQMRVAGRQASVTSLQRTIISQTDPETARLIVHGLDSYFDLSTPDKYRFNGQMNNMLFDFQLTRTLHDEGSFPDEGLAVHRRWVLDILSTPGGKEWWGLANYVDLETRRYVDGFLTHGDGKDVRRVLFPSDATSPPPKSAT